MTDPKPRIIDGVAYVHAETSLDGDAIPFLDVDDIPADIVQ